jgi:DNA-binding transcriptional ArsR family regulator
VGRHYSPPGTYEAIRKEVLEDPTWPPAAFRVALYLVTKPPWWEVNEGQVADATGLKPSTVEAAIRDLRRRGLIEDEQVREGRRIKKWVVRFRADLILARRPGPEPPSSTPPKNRGLDATCDDADGAAVLYPPKKSGTRRDLQERQLPGGKRAGGL